MNTPLQTLTVVFHEEVRSLVNPMSSSDGLVVTDVTIKQVVTAVGEAETLLVPFGDDEHVLWCHRGHDVSAMKMLALWSIHGFSA